MKKLLTILGVMLALAWPLYMMVAQPRIPLLDSERTLLAETYLDGMCSGITFGNTGGHGDKGLMEQCLREKAEDYNDEIDHAIVQSAWCVGFNKITQYPVNECKGVLATYRYWPTMEGQLTDKWNARFPYPLEDSFEAKEQGDSRTGDRQTNEREDITRP